VKVHHPTFRPVAILVLLGLSLSLPANAQTPAKTKTTASKKTKTQPKPVSELARLRDEYVAATKDYKSKLQSLLAIYEKSVPKAETELEKSKELFAAGLISHKELEASEARVKQAQDNVADVQAKIKTADSQIADALLESEAETKIARSKPLPKGGMMSSPGFIRYNGGAAWSLSDAWKVQQFFQATFKKPLPIAVFGQGSIHDRWRLDHRNAMDVSLHPDGVEGQALLGYLRANGIPFLAFRQAIPGTATGPHIHVGRPSHRY
jgi:hypothetical protein